MQPVACLAVASRDIRQNAFAHCARRFRPVSNAGTSCIFGQENRSLEQSLSVR